MLPQLASKLQEIKAARKLDPDAWIDQKTDILNKYLTNSGLKAVVVNVSGGIDSALTILLAVKASQKPGSPLKKVLGVIQPIHSTEQIIKRAVDFLTEAKIEFINVDQSSVFDLLVETVAKVYPVETPPFAKGQLKSYLRTPVAYYTAQLLGANGTPAIVLGTGNYDEDGFLYYFCKPGDGTTDVQLIHDLHKSEVFAISRVIGVPESILIAPPSADLQPGQTDEEELGFSYDFVELYTELLQKAAERDAWVQTLDEANRVQWDDLSGKIDQVHRRNKHKEKWPINLDIISPIGDNYAF